MYPFSEYQIGDGREEIKKDFWTKMAEKKNKIKITPKLNYVKACNLKGTTFSSQLSWEMTDSWRMQMN
mgnify:CR=1 FL=1